MGKTSSYPMRAVYAVHAQWYDAVFRDISRPYNEIILKIGVFWRFMGLELYIHGNYNVFLILANFIFYCNFYHPLETTNQEESLWVVYCT